MHTEDKKERKKTTTVVVPKITLSVPKDAVSGGALEWWIS